MLNFHRATCSEIDLLCQMSNESYRYHFSHYWLNKIEMEIFLRKNFAPAIMTLSIQLPNTHWFIIELDEDKLGFAQLTLQETLPQLQMTALILTRSILCRGKRAKIMVRLPFWLWKKRAGKRGLNNFGSMC